jgi:hypothetical protein
MSMTPNRRGLAARLWAVAGRHRRRDDRSSSATAPDPLAALLESAAANQPVEATFEGWGMRTDRALPWDDDYQWASLRESLTALRSFDLGPVMRIMVPDVDLLAWRHWVVAFTVRYVERMNAAVEDMTLAECGVGDGMSAFVALRELRDITAQRARFVPEFHLYESFAPMRECDLSETELANPVYESLSLDRTQRNLAGFEDSLVWHVGYLPESLEQPPRSPARVDWLHIDLNASKPTVAACRYFLPRLCARGVILFDDYGDQKFSDTKKAVDRFLADAAGLLLKFPTGQAVYLHAAAADPAT